MTEPKLEPELSSRLESILLWIEETAKTTEAFVIEQTPIYIQELLAWNFWHSFLFFSIGVGMLIALGFCIKKITTSGGEFWEDENVPVAVPVVLGTIICLIVGPILTFNNIDWLKIKIAPRVWLVEYVADKIK